MRAFWILVGLAAWGAGACGQTAGSESGSGVPTTKALIELTPEEEQQLCDWSVETLGGDGAEYMCGSTSVTVEASQASCVELIGSCDATVSDVEACIEEQRAALEACELDGRTPACERLASLCDGGDDPSVDPPPVAEACVPGELIACACADGSRGAQECTAAREYGPCTCNVEPVACVPGEAQPCVCPDGTQGAQSCTADGAWAACVCETQPNTGPCNPEFCPTAGSGARCCISPNGPCGLDFGSGCTTSSFDG